MDYIIYIIINLINHKIYIGKSTKSLKKRWSVHKAHSKNQKTCKTPISRAIHKYGHENFFITILEYHDCKHQLKKRETDLILEYKSCDPNIGYNLVTEHRNDPTLWNISPEFRKRVSTKKHIINAKRIGSSGFRGVYWANNDGKHSACPWMVRFEHLDVKVIKRYKNIENAIETYDKLVLYVYGKDARLNRPENRNEYLKDNLEGFYKEMVSRRKTSSHFYGITYNKKSNKYLARICDINDNKRLNLGFYENELVAAETYDRVALFLYKEKAELNFPEKKPLYLKDDLRSFYRKFKDPLKQRLKQDFTSKYRGVTKHGQANIWCAEFRINKQRFRKTFTNEKEAARFYDQMAKRFLGSKAKLNFPNLTDFSPPQSNNYFT